MGATRQQSWPQTRTAVVCVLMLCVYCVFPAAGRGSAAVSGRHSWAARLQGNEHHHTLLQQTCVPLQVSDGLDTHARLWPRRSSSSSTTQT